MRPILPIGFLALLLVLLLNAQSGVYDWLLPRAEPELHTVSEGSTVRVFSAGVVLHPERFGRREVQQAFVVDGELLHQSAPAGLRAARFQVGSGRIELASFAVADSDEDVEALASFLGDSPIDSVVGLGVLRLISPRGAGSEARGEALGRVLAGIGAETAPQSRANPSWAYLAVRRPQGWVRLGEALSETKGVMLAFNVSPDLSIYDDADPPSLVDTRTRAPLVIYFEEDMEDEFTRPRHGFLSSYEVARVELDGILASPPYGPEAERTGELENKILWPYVKLPPGSAFETHLGIASWRRAGCPGVEFQVLIDGEVVGRKRLAEDPEEPDAWLPWSVDLSPWGGRWISLELRTARLDLEPGKVPQFWEPLYWGDPAIVTDRAVSPPAGLEHGLREKTLAGLDENHDSVVQRAEMIRGLIQLDADGDGRLSPSEQPGDYPWLVELMDLDGDGSADRSELEAWYERMDEVAPW